MKSIPIILGLFVTVSWGMRDKYGRKMILRTEDEERKNLACALAKICVHDTQEVCGALEQNNDKRKYRRFLDTCDVLEYNCLYNKKYAVTDVSRCKDLDPIPPDNSKHTTSTTTMSNNDSNDSETTTKNPATTDDNSDTADTATTDGDHGTTDLNSGSDDNNTGTPNKDSGATNNDSGEPQDDPTTTPKANRRRMKKLKSNKNNKKYRRWN